MYNYRNGKGRQPTGEIAQLRDTALHPLSILGMLLIAVVFLMPGNSHAAPLNTLALPGSPLIDTNNAFIDYVFTPGVGGTLTVEGLYIDDDSNAATPNVSGPVSQSLAVPDSWGLSSDSVPIVNPAAAGSLANYVGTLSPFTLFDTTYNLTANFDQFGAFTGGSYAVTGVVDVDTADGVQFAAAFDPAGDCGPDCSQGDLMSGELLTFGFVGTQTQSGFQDDLLLEFNISVTGGDFYYGGFANTAIRSDFGIILSGDVAYGQTGNKVTGDGTTNANGSYGAEWDPLQNNDMTAFTENFVSCSGCPLETKTFVPVPAAVWLFGSGLFGLIGLGARNRRRN